MSEEHTQILLGIQKELSTNTEATKSIQKDMVDVKTQVAFTNGKVKLHTKIMLVTGAVLATYFVMSGNEKIISIFKLFF
jgi:hypothetical protein